MKSETWTTMENYWLEIRGGQQATWRNKGVHQCLCPLMVSSLLHQCHYYILSMMLAYTKVYSCIIYSIYVLTDIKCSHVKELEMHIKVVQ